MAQSHQYWYESHLDYELRKARQSIANKQEEETMAHKFYTQVMSTDTGVDCYGYPYKKAPFASKKGFDTFEAALNEAKKTASKQKTDVEVWGVKATVKFPIPDLEVVMEDTAPSK